MEDRIMGSLALSDTLRQLTREQVLDLLQGATDYDTYKREGNSKRNAIAYMVNRTVDPGTSERQQFPTRLIRALYSAGISKLIPFNTASMIARNVLRTVPEGHPVLTFTELEDEYTQKKAEREARDAQRAENTRKIEEIELKVNEFIDAHGEWERFQRRDREPDNLMWQLYPEPGSWSSMRVSIRRKSYGEDGYMTEISWYSTTESDLDKVLWFRDCYNVLCEVAIFINDCLTEAGLN